MNDSGVPDSGARDVRGWHVPGLILVLALVAIAAGWAGGLQLFAGAPGNRDGGAAGGAGQPSPTPGASASVDTGSSDEPTASVPERTSPAPSAGASPSAAASPPAAPLDPEFGMSGHLMWHDAPTAIHQLDMLAQDGLGVVRFDVSWRNMEPSPGTYRYLDKLDQIVNAAVQRHLTLIVTIDETPGWANGGQGLWVPPDDPGDYAAFAGFLAGRYAGRVNAWEIWNEPDIALFWQPAPDAVVYTKLLLRASAAIRAADPSALVIGGAIAFGNTDFVKAMYANGAKGSFDALSVHPYTLTNAPADESNRQYSLTATLDDIHGVMTAAGDGGTPIWVTEFGWASVGLNSVSPSQRVQYVAQTVPLIRARSWVHVFTMYTIDTQDSERYGLSTNGTRSAAWRAYVDAVHAAPGS